MNSPAVYEAKKKGMRLPPEETLELRHSVEVSGSHIRSFCGKSYVWVWRGARGVLLS